MNVIETRNLTKYYRDIRGIENLNLSVKEGEIFGFIGPNGAGKSTTIRTLLNFIFPTSGSAKVMGLDIVKDNKEIKKLIGYIPSEVHYYDDMKVRDLFQYSAKFYEQKFEEKTKRLAEIFEVDMEKNISDLSFGNKKKVAIIQALHHSPKLLILDEPTSGLDPLMQNRFFEVLKEENNHGTTIFFSSHVLNEVQKLCHRVAIIKDGKIIEVEEIEKLRKRNYKKVTIELEKSNMDLTIKLDGITDFSADNNLLKFLFSGDVKQLLNYIYEINPQNFWVEEPSLEEIFMHYYEKEEK
ncbi:ABC transporter [Vulcanibacillus modesticaldus]|uniref:ABC transporter n=1 Tax=Vulcanibacillus modesticaldus TaxID=337097 RepID=A0A1D2YWB3_9BACI|nr:ABC transporter ATP-binding protein [Vulcanibacillus modesticaldus]OEF99925.1 ABC transporter [Vulcanibacillus modesticaldus]